MAKSYVIKVAGFYKSQPDAFCKKGAVRKVFAKFTGKSLCQRLYFNEVAFLRLQKRDSVISVFL